MAKQLWLLIALALLVAAAGFETQPAHASNGAIVASQERVCSLLGPNKTSTGIGGKDGGTSIKVGSRSFWTFGDVVNGPQTSLILPNAIATTSQTDASGCLSLTPKVNPSNNAVALLNRLPGQEVTVWPDGMVSTDNSNVHFYYASVRKCDAQEPCAGDGWTVRGVGLAKFDTATMTATRIGDCTQVANCLFWQDGDGTGITIFGATSVLSDGFVYVYLSETSDGVNQDAVRVARVPAGSVENKSAYQYLSLAGATPTWVKSLTQSSSLGSFPGLSVAYNQYLGKWTAVYTTAGHGSIAMRVGGTPYGPWGDEVTLIDCAAEFPADTGLRCYFGRQHNEFESGGGQTIYVSYSNQDSYQTYLHKVVLQNGDRDSDGFSDAAELYMGTDPDRSCGVDAWPPDLLGDGRVAINDVALVLHHAGEYNRRYDMSGDGRITMVDLLTQIGNFGRRCPG